MTMNFPPAGDLMLLDWGAWQQSYLSEEDSRKLPESLRDDAIFSNNLFQVNVRAIPCDDNDERRLVLHLSIKLISREPFHDWRVFQRIKNEIAGEEYEAVEIYPPESQLVDTANQYHLWVLPNGVRLPFGFRSHRFVCDETSTDGSKQRPFAPGWRPADCMTGAQMAAKIKAVLNKG